MVAYPQTEPALVASTGVNGFALQNATPNILTWTAPNDGQMHRVFLNAFIVVGAAQTGGAVTMNTTVPGGVASNPVVFAGGLTGNQSQWFNRLIAPGTTVTLVQSSAQTAGAATVYAELWAA